MTRRIFLTFWLVAIFMAACQSGATPPPVATPATTAAPETAAVVPVHADAIRFALVGETALTNVWAYYDAPGANYNNRAIQDGFWPSLYHLSPLTGTFEPYLADGAFSPLETDSSFLASNVTLRPGLRWSDGTPLTADDVAFTVNTALSFHLGLDWAAYYNPDVIYHAEALDSQTVRFYFRTQPSIENWQYGALQGPIVNKAFWEPRLTNANALLLANPGMDQSISNLQQESARLQGELNDLLYQLGLLDVASTSYEVMQAQIYGKQDEINAVSKQIEILQDQKEAAFASARQVLYALDAAGEPIFGPFITSSRGTDEFENTVNPFYPFQSPNFDRAVYRVYKDEQSAVKALGEGEVNVILKQGGFPNPEQHPISGWDSSNTAIKLAAFPRGNIRVLAFNLTNPFAGDFSLRRALVCMANQHIIPAAVHYSEGFILSKNEFGFSSDITYPCAGLDEATRLEQAIGYLDAGGYGWDVKPAWDGAPHPGSGLSRGGVKVPPLSILVTQDDPIRVEAASIMAEQFEILGFDVSVEQADEPEVLYRVFDSRQYDMVILGWRLARYPAYLCDLFGPGNPYSYERTEMSMYCNDFRSALDLDAAQQVSTSIQSLLAADVPVLPLYAEVGYDVYSGVVYPFNDILDGVAGLYGAPGLAIPLVP